MRRSPVWPICLYLLLVGAAAPTFGADDPRLAETPGAPASPPEGAVVIPGLEAVGAIARAFAGAAATIMADQRLVGNRVEEQNINRSTLFENSGRDNRGIVNINQDAGNLNIQANVAVLAIASNGTDVGPAVHALGLAATGARTDNTVITGGGHRENRIASSFAGTVGLVNVNQSAGNLDSQANLVGLSLGVLAVPDLAQLGDSALSEVTARNRVIREGPAGSRVDVVTDSFAAYRGVGLVSQVSGDLNVVRNIATISAMVGTDALTLTSTAGIGR